MKLFHLFISKICILFPMTNDLSIEQELQAMMERMRLLEEKKCPN